MEVKEAIFILKHRRYTMNNIDDIISLLQQGEKYRQNHIGLIEELEKRQAIIRELTKYRDMWYDNKQYSNTKKIRDLEQKYFPKIKDEPHFYECSSKDPHLKKVYFKEAK